MARKSAPRSVTKRAARKNRVAVKSRAGAKMDSAARERALSPRERIVAALMALLAENPIEQIEFADVAARANVSLSALRDEFGSLLAIVAEQVKQIDRVVLDGVDPTLADEPPRERLFDVLMRRLEALAAYKAAMRSLMKSAIRNPGLALALNGLSVRSQRWMLSAAGIDTAGPKGAIRAQGLALLFANVMRTFVDDKDSDLSASMAALDRELERGQRWSGFVDDLCAVPASLRRRGKSRRRRGEEAAAA